MRIRDVLNTKPAEVLTVEPETAVPSLLAALAARGVGAAVVLDADGAVVGMVSERDVVRHLHHRGADVLADTVGSIMTGPVTSCGPDDEVDSLGAVMTERRIRHLPVLEQGRLTGIVSIGDVVKVRLGELEAHRDQLEAYIAG
ncbi:CBS domain-containing protein [Actinomycetospora termitidis]|uniref:CBS domain-containing protein n=1 Tax=Actinomycetospora termitidis TaxID=3053470 RepID=A0ABT7M1I9_9PSEU|nr:CBS domain-containing protein [Actinomycetospora sp. Odt1-22]MDL5154331.1 CBS domain-containing protein [Actinomycetospora sp. Odt1-22]